MRNLSWLAAAAVLAGCSGGGGDPAVEACSAELAVKLSGKSYVIDKAAMAQAAKPEDGGVVNITAPVTFDPGLPGEYTQTFECKARSNAGRMSVISLTFNW